MSAPQHSTVALGEVRLALRPDLAFTLQQYGGHRCYVIEDATNSRFYRIGLPEYKFISLLDGQTSLRAALQLTANALGPDAFSEEDAAAICKWLVHCQLARPTAPGDAGQLLDAARTAARRRRSSWLNPLIMKLPLVDPDPWLSRLAPRLAWLTGGHVLSLGLLLVFVAGHQAVTHLERIASASRDVLAPHNWLYLALSWLLLKLIHEASHALVCKRYGGQVREAGLVLIALAPICYVDVTSAWRWPSKWQRIHVSAAGMLADLAVGGLAVLLFCHVDHPLVAQHARNVMVAATVTTLLFNANPLMRFDGYYILADVLEIPNLYPLGQEYVRYLGRRYLLGVPAVLPRWPWRTALIIKTYAVASCGWRLLVTVGLILVAEAMFYGAGIVLAVIGAIAWFGLPALRLASYLFKDHGREPPRLGRLALVAGGGGLAILLTLQLAPWPLAVEAPAVVAFAPLTTLRAASPGFVHRLHVAPGDIVQAGQVLILLSNPRLEAELAELELAVQQSELRSRVYRQQEQIAAAQAEDEARHALEVKRRERSNQVAELTIRSPVDGQVLQADLQSLTGTYVAEGTELLSIGDEQQKELVLSVAQADGELFASQRGKPVDVWLHATPAARLAASLEKISPRATTVLARPALGAMAGGPLPVRPRRDRQTGTEEAWELVEPRLSGAVPLPPERAQLVRAGQRATVKLRIRRGNLGEGLYQIWESWLRGRLASSRGA